MKTVAPANENAKAHRGSGGGSSMGMQEDIATPMNPTQPPPSKELTPRLDGSRHPLHAPAGPRDAGLRRALLADPAMHESLRTVIRLRGVPRQDVDDVLHVVLAEMMADEALPVHDREQARKYMGKCARRRSVDHARSRTRRARREVDADERLRGGASPEDMVMLSHLVREGQARYPIAFAWWVRFVVHGEPQNEIARSAGVHADHVQHTIAAVRDHLRRFGSVTVIVLMFLAGWWSSARRPGPRGEPLPELSSARPDDTLAPPASPLDVARSLRARAEQEAAAGDWASAAHDLDDARQVDPSGETPEVLELRRRLHEPPSTPASDSHRDPEPPKQFRSPPLPLLK